MLLCSLRSHAFVWPVLADTDSCYFAMAAENLEDIKKPEITAEEYDAALKAFMVTDESDPWNRRQPGNNAAKSMPSPHCRVFIVVFALLLLCLGLYHKEFEGTAICALSPKMYCAQQSDGSVKCSAKGISLRSNPDLAKFQVYLDVLKTQIPAGGINYMMVPKVGGGVTKLTQYRSSLSWTYIKRQTMANSYSTKPLNV